MDDVRTGVFWRSDIESILRGVVAAYLAGAPHPRDAIIVGRFVLALAESFGIDDLGERSVVRLIEGRVHHAQ